MKKIRKPLLLSLLLLVGIVLGLVQYFGLTKLQRGKTAEMAATAIVDAVNAAADLHADDEEHRVEILSLMGHARNGVWHGPVSVATALTVQGSIGLSAVCASLPRVRDAVNVLLSDRVARAMRTGQALDPADVAAYGESLKATLNRSFDEQPIVGVELSIRNDFAGAETGCNNPRAAGSKG